MSHNIPIAELYKLIDTCSNSEENEYCAVLIKIESLELQKKYEGRFLLQVWNKEGAQIYSKILQYHLHAWNLNGDHLIFV